MRKLFAFLLAVCLLLPACSLAEEPDGIYGCWVHTETLTSGCPSLTFICLREDHTCFFLIQAFRDDEAGLGRTFVGTWAIEDGTVLAKTGNNTTTPLLFDDNFAVAYNPNTLDLYIHTSKYIDQSMAELIKQ